MAIVGRLSKWLERYLCAPTKGALPVATCDPAKFGRALRPGDVVLVDSNSRVSMAIKYLTHSTWAHAALYTGPIPGKCGTNGEPHVFVEAELGLGVISSPLSRYAMTHTRICRPVGLTPAEINMVTAYAIARLGDEYDTRNVLDLARYLLPNPPVPARFRRQMLALGSGSPTRAICSTLIAQAFQSVSYPVLPVIECLFEVPGGKVTGEALAANQQRHREILQIRHHSLYTPADFDVSPYFAVVKPTVEAGFDPHNLSWH